ncbi:MAG TPA: primosomal protein N' [Candidatus Limnocylindria bacterium]|nr:primosomal protein N' [Candidatus Limnocylindria bacterium]
MVAEVAAGQTVRVAVEALADRPERAFSYLLPRELGSPEPGSLLLVPYGRRLALGYLLPGTPEPEPGIDLRSVEAVVSAPMLTPDLLALAEEISVYYCAPLGATIAAMLPPGLESRLERRWGSPDPGRLPEQLGLALSAADELTDAALKRALGPRWSSAADGLRRSGALTATWSLRPPELQARRIRTLRRLPDADAAPRAAPLQRAILDALGAEARTLAEVAEEIGVEQGAVLAAGHRLVARGAAVMEWQTVERDPRAHRPTLVARDHDLADEQRSALSQVEALPAGGELLLEGVAAAGKTDVYLAALAGVLAEGGTAIVLVPEVSLVTQLADRVASLVGDQLAVLHSGLSAGERHDTWWRILRGEARVVVGTRMAVFAPLADLRLVVVDEAHDGAYKADRTPRYDARWVARRRVALTGAGVVMGTATPDVVTIARVRGGLVERARLVERRVGLVPLVEIVDLRAELAEGNRSIFSRALAEALSRLKQGSEQAILLMNRRGAATFVLCRDCGESLRCPDCDLPFVFHLSGAQLRCHHCGRTARPPEKCPHCGSNRIRYFGAGTQRVEAELRSRFPHLRVSRLDSDALAARRGFEAIYDDFRDGRVDVLVGTQLAAKGLDLPSVTLAAVIAADVTLNLPDYLAPERTFQLLAQVAGRAGRGEQPGRVLIQTYAASHYAIRAAGRMDVDGFADEELTRRRLLGYPPSSVLARLLVADPDRARAESRGRDAAAAVASPGVEVHGPLPSYVPRRAGRWRFQVVIRAVDEAARAAALERVPPGVAIDVDPESLL